MMITTRITTGAVALEIGAAAAAEATVLERKEVVAVPWRDTTLLVGEGVTHHLHPHPMRSDERWLMKARASRVVPDHQVGNFLCKRRDNQMTPNEVGYFEPRRYS
jgi:hypothetical protein